MTAHTMINNNRQQRLPPTFYRGIGGVFSMRVTSCNDDDDVGASL